MRWGLRSRAQPEPVQAGRRTALRACDYAATTEPATFGRLAGTFDPIINTVSADLETDAYLTLLRLDGVLVKG